MRPKRLPINFTRSFPDHRVEYDFKLYKLLRQDWGLAFRVHNNPNPDHETRLSRQLRRHPTRIHPQLHRLAVPNNELQVRLRHASNRVHPRPQKRYHRFQVLLR